MALAYSIEGSDQEQTQEEREDKLLRMLKAEEEEALGYAQSEITGQQIDALKRYFGESYGDEEEGRSQVRTREVLESIEWTRPDLMRVFSSGGNVVFLEENQPQDARFAKDAADYLTWMFFSDNPGFQLLDDFAFDGLLHRRGYLAVYWRDKEYAAPQTLTGLNIMQVQGLMNDPQVEIIGQDFDQESEAGGISLMVRRVKTVARAEIVSIAPEDMRIGGRTVDLDSARYVGRVLRMLCGEAVRLWEDKGEEIVAQCGKGDTGMSRRSDDVRQYRFQDGQPDRMWDMQGDVASREIEVLEEYIRTDLNEDGYPELIRSYRCGDVILEESEVEENPFASWTPIRIPHRFMGLSTYDIAEDLQRRSTVLTRAALDAVYQAVVPREAYDATKVSAEGQAALLSTAAGTKIPVDGPPGDAIMPIVADKGTAAIAWEALQHTQIAMENRTGATRQTRGLDSDVLTDAHSGVALGKLQLNADARKEMTARNMGDGLTQMFAKLYRLVCRNQNEERQAKVGGKWCQFDPRTWNSALRVGVYAGGVNREQTLMGLQLIGMEQDKVLATLGPGNPIVTAKNRFRYQEELCRHAGHKDASPFFTEVPDEPETDEQGQPVIDPQTGQPKMKPWAPPPTPSPDEQKVQAQIAESQARLQMDGQKAQQDAQIKQFETEAKSASDVQKAQLDAQIAQMKAEGELALQRDRLMLEMQMKREQMAFEMQLKREQFEFEKEQSEKELAIKEKVATAKASGVGDTKFGGDPG